MLHAATPRAVPRLRPWSRLALIGACLLATAHAGPSTPASSAQVSLADVDAITIMPVAFPAGPMLIERDEPLTALYGEFDDYIYGALLRKLALKGYVLDRARNWQRPADRLNAGPWQLDTLGGDRYAGQMVSVPVCDGPPPRPGSCMLQRPAVWRRRHAGRRSRSQPFRCVVGGLPQCGPGPLYIGACWYTDWSDCFRVGEKPFARRYPGSTVGACRGGCTTDMNPGQICAQIPWRAVNATIRGRRGWFDLLAIGGVR